MPVASAITLADAVPANHVYSPVQVSTGRALLLNKATTIPASNEQLVLGFDLASARRPTDRILTQLAQPLEKTVDGTVVVRSTPRFVGDWVLPSDMTDAERNNFWTLVKNFIAHAMVQSYVRSRDPMYG